MATLAACIEIHQAAQGPRSVVATPKGLAFIAIYQLRRALIDCEPADRDEVLDMLSELFAEQNERAWTDFSAALKVQEG